MKIQPFTGLPRLLLLWSALIITLSSCLKKDLEGINLKPSRLANVSGTPSITNLNSKGQIRVNNAPVYPIMLYSQWDYTKDQINYQLDHMAEAGMDVIFLEANNKTDVEMTAILDKAAGLNIKVILKHHRGSDYHDISLVNTFKNHPAIFGWLVSDDITTNWPTDADRAELQAISNSVKAADPNHVTVLSDHLINGVTNYQLNVGLTDVSNFQFYPITNQPIVNDEHIWTRKVWGLYPANMASNSSPKKAGSAAIQTFSWYEAGDRMPQPQEIDVDTWTSVVAGCQGGITFYTFETNNNSTLPDEYPAQWAKMKHLTNEIKTLKNVILNGILTKKPYVEGDLTTWSSWAYNGKVHVAAINMSSQPQYVNITLPIRTPSTITNTFANRALHLSYSNGRLVGTIPPLTVDVLSLGGAGNYWWALENPQSNANRGTAPSIVDGDLLNNYDLPENWDVGKWQAAGITWFNTSRANINSVKLHNGTFVTGGNGCFTQDPYYVRVQYQTSTNGTWTDAPGWNVQPVYPYTTAASGRVYTFSGQALTQQVTGIRVIGKVHTNDISWALSVKEIEAFAGSSKL